MPTDFVSRPGHVVTNTRLNVRRGAPSTQAAIAAKVEVGTTLAVRGVVAGEVVSGNGEWYAGTDDAFFWSGGCGSLVTDDAAPGAPGLDVRRRPNGSILPLRDAELRSRFGDPHETEGVGGRVTPDPAWVTASLVQVAIPVLSGMGFATVTVHTKARDSFLRVFAAIAAAGLDGHIRTCAGTFVARHKAWNPARDLSPHTWGIAIDLNAEWNGYGSEPAPLGAIGSVRALVPLFEAEGFAWGGFFETQSQRDGMHFELARRDL